MELKQCILEKRTAIRQFYSDNKGLSLLLAAVLFAAIFLRLLFINATDITGDEAFYTSYGYKLAAILWKQPIAGIGLGIIAGLFVYAIAFKRKLWAAVLLGLGILAAKYLVGIPYATHAPSPFFIFATAGLVFATGLTPNIAGELISSASLIGLAFLALWFGKRFGRNAAVISFVLVALSPLSLFMSGTSFLTPLGMFLLFLSVALFFKSLDNPKFFPAAGLVFSLAFITRYPMLAMLPFFLALLFINRKKLALKKAGRDIAIAAIVFGSVFLFFLPLVTGQFFIAANWLEDESFRNDFTEANFSSFVAENIGSEARPLSDNFFIARAMSLFYSPFGLAVIALGLVYAAWHSAKFKDKKLALLLLYGLAMFGFFLFVMTDKRINYLIEFEFPLLLMAGIFLGSEKIGFAKPRLAIAALFALFFIFQSATVVSVHNFNAISEFVDSIPEEEGIFLGGRENLKDPVKYYREHWVFDTEVNKPVFNKIFPPDEKRAAIFEEKKALVVTEFDGIARANYALVTPAFLESEKGKALSQFKRCKTIRIGSQESFVALARNTCP